MKQEWEKKFKLKNLQVQTVGQVVIPGDFKKRYKRSHTILVILILKNKLTEELRFRLG